MTTDRPPYHDTSSPSRRETEQVDHSQHPVFQTLPDPSSSGAPLPNPYVQVFSCLLTIADVLKSQKHKPAVQSKVRCPCDLGRDEAIKYSQSLPPPQKKVDGPPSKASDKSKEVFTNEFERGDQPPRQFFGVQGLMDGIAEVTRPTISPSGPDCTCHRSSRGIRGQREKGSLNFESYVVNIVRFQHHTNSRVL